jgi:endonuclease/exonuclease/phosphatase (EEP) superfamily protein YafD
MANASDKPQRGPVRLFVSFVAACTALVILFTFAGFAARYWWRLEQLCHFRVQYFWLLVLGSVVLLLGRRRRLAALAGIAAVVNLATIVPIYVPTRRDHAAEEVGSKSVRLVSFNVLGKNRQYDDVAQWLRSESADVVLLMEVQPHWMPTLESLREQYPHQHVVSRRDNFGIALLSKSPWDKIETVEFGSAELPSVVATFRAKGQTWTFVGTHPLPPGSAQAAAARNEQLADISKFVKRQRGPVLVAGDLNLTEHSPYFGDLLRAGDLRDSRQGIGIQASWAARLPGLDLPLDHVLLSREWIVESRQVGPHLGSDHRPVLAELMVVKSSEK